MIPFFQPATYVVGWVEFMEDTMKNKIENINKKSSSKKHKKHDNKIQFEKESKVKEYFDNCGC